MGVTPIEGISGIGQNIPQTARVPFTLERFGRGLVTIIETLKLALDALRAHKLRSFLTLLGVILAVTTLVAVMSVVNGLTGYVADKAANLGADVFVLTRFGIITSNDEWIKAQKRPLITTDEFAKLKEGMHTSRQIAAVLGTSSDVRSGNALLEDVNVQGVTPNYSDVRNIVVGSGRFLTEADETHHSPVAFIGADVVRKFFYNVDPIGKTIRAGSHSYTVVGVAAVIGSAFGQSQDRFLYIPLGTYSKEWGNQRDSLTLFIQAGSAEMMASSEDEARMLLRAWRHQPWDSADSFGIIGSDSIMGLFKQLTGNIFMVAVGLTAVFLVVGGIVIMNIMLVSVTERTREIGIRKALGARREDVLLQFLIESVILALVGGALGVLSGVVIAEVVTALIGMPSAIKLWAVAAGLTVAASVGVFFGVYPARKAARLDPIVALRFEM